MSALTPHHRLFRRLEAVRATDRGLAADVAGETFAVDVCRDDVVRLRMSRAGRVEDHPSAAVCVDPLSLPVEVVTREVGDGTWEVTTRAITVRVEADPFRVVVIRADGTPVLDTGLDGEGRSQAYATLNDQLVLRRARGADDGFYGLGSKTGAFDRAGRDFVLWNTDVLNPHASAEFRAGRAADDPRADMTSTEFDPYYVNIPLLHHHPGRRGPAAASFVDNPWRGAVDLTREDVVEIAFEGGQWCEYVLAGPRISDSLEAYTWLTGRMPVPEAWTLGYHQCRWEKWTEADVLEVSDRLADADVPCDAVWLDIEHMDGHRILTWDPLRFPDPDRLVRDLTGRGRRVVTIVDPGVKADGYWLHEDGDRADVWCRTEGGDVYIGQVWPGATVFPDFAVPEVRDWWAAHIARRAEEGVAGIWIDMNEPATGEIPSERMRFVHGTEPHARWHNEYAILMAMATQEGLRRARPDEEPFVLTRAGSAGIQRYAASWLGDNQSSWAHLRLGIAMANGLGLSGQPFVGADIGGFQGSADGELLVRWTQYGALTPFCRNHSEIGTADQFPWSFGAEVEEHVSAAVRLRYRLMPYLRECFARASRTGEPIHRPLVLDFQDDPVAASVDDQFLLGPDLLVAPVVEPAATTRRLYLPTGAWRRFGTDEVLEGGRWVEVEAPLSAIPVLARGTFTDRDFPWE